MKWVTKIFKRKTTTPAEVDISEYTTLLLRSAEIEKFICLDPPVYYKLIVLTLFYNNHSEVINMSLEKVEQFYRCWLINQELYQCH